MDRHEPSEFCKNSTLLVGFEKCHIKAKFGQCLTMESHIGLAPRLTQLSIGSSGISIKLTF
eukprot:1095188-Pelagomonas_calceolata.AAC.9